MFVFTRDVGLMLQLWPTYSSCWDLDGALKSRRRIEKHVRHYFLSERGGEVQWGFSNLILHIHGTRLSYNSLLNDKYISEFWTLILHIHCPSLVSVNILNTRINCKIYTPLISIPTSEFFNHMKNPDALNGKFGSKSHGSLGNSTPPSGELSVDARAEIISAISDSECW